MTEPQNKSLLSSIPGIPPAPPMPQSLPTPRLVTVNSVNWENVLDFAHLFRGFRLAINPAKLAIALLAIMMMYAAGRLFDVVWGPQVYDGEVESFAVRSPEDFLKQRQQRLDARENSLLLLLENVPSLSLVQRQELAESPRRAYGTLKAHYRGQFEAEVKIAADRRAAAEREGGTVRPSAYNTKTPAEYEQEDRARAADILLSKVTNARVISGRGIFDRFLQFETTQFDQLVENTLTFVRVSPVRARDGQDTAAVSGGLISRDPTRLWRSDTIAGCIANMTITAPRWLFTATGPMQWRPTGDAAGTWSGWFKMIAWRAAYLITLLAFALFSLVLMALAGASISRLSALELAGVERAPLKEVFLFAFRRLGVFIKTPIMPFVILLAFGIVMAVGGLLGSIPLVGPLILGAIFVLFLLGAFVLMLLMLGILGGFNLLYPTVAVEGSDAFDAMSRSFAYVYARPWRLIFYTVTSLIYGAITFLFVSFAVYLVLLISHTFVGWGTDFFGLHYGKFSGVPLLETLWPSPQFLRLVQPINWYAMSWPEFLGALFLHFWIFLLITGIGAYVISYYFSSHTIMYLLLRRSVDGQGLREIYLDEEAPAPAPTAAAATVTAAPPTAATPAPAVPPPPATAPNP